MLKRIDLAGVERRAPDEPAAAFVPTWSIETWLAHLHGTESIDETQSLEEAAGLRFLWRDETAAAATCKSAAAAWGNTPTPLPSLQAAYGEASRVGLGPKP